MACAANACGWSLPLAADDGKARGRSRGGSRLPKRVGYDPCASTANSSSATMLVILIIGFTAGPAVSL